MERKTVELFILDYYKVDLLKLISSDFFLPAEKEKFKEYKDENVLKEKIASLYLKKKYIGDYYIDLNNKPQSDNIFFNISHSYGRAVLAKTKINQIGVDIEKIRDINPKLITYISNKEELDYIEDEKTFFEIWTSKESILKSSGMGIKIDLKEVDGLPLSGKRNLLDNNYYSKIKYIGKYVISITLKTSADFKIKVNHIKKIEY